MSAAAAAQTQACEDCQRPSAKLYCGECADIAHADCVDPDYHEDAVVCARGDAVEWARREMLLGRIGLMTFMEFERYATEAT